jgi:hypothetical protein
MRAAPPVASKKECGDRLHGSCGRSCVSTSILFIAVAVASFSPHDDRSNSSIHHDGRPSNVVSSDAPPVDLGLVECAGMILAGSS